MAPRREHGNSLPPCIEVSQAGEGAGELPICTRDVRVNFPYRGSRGTPQFAANIAATETTRDERVDSRP